MDHFPLVHILSGDLILHKRTLEPIRTMVYGLRRYDQERSRALEDTMALEMKDSSDTDSGEEKQKTSASSLSHARRRRRRKELFESEHFPQEGDVGAHHSATYEPSRGQHRKTHVSSGGHKVEGYFSYKAKVYLVSSCHCPV